jgi:hypothetical protein
MRRRSLTGLARAVSRTKGALRPLSTLAPQSYRNGLTRSRAEAVEALEQIAAGEASAPPDARGGDVAGAVVVQVAPLAEGEQVFGGTILGLVIQVRHGQEHAVAGHGVPLALAGAAAGIPGLARRRPLAPPPGAIADATRDRIPIGRVAGAVEGHGVIG